MKPKIVFNIISILVLIVVIFLPNISLASNIGHEWAEVLGGTAFEQVNSMITDASGNVYTVGRFTGTVDFDPGAGTYNLTSAGSNDIFVSKLNSSGDFVFAKAMGFVGNDSGLHIILDSSNNIYLTGVFTGTVDFDPGAGTYNLTSAGGTDVFASKLDSSGDFVFAKAFGGTGSDFSNYLLVDNTSNIFIVGNFAGTVDFDPGAGTYNLTSAGSNDIFVSKLNSSGDFVFAKAMGGTGADDGKALVLDADGNIFIIGNFTGTVDFDPGAGTYNLTSAGSNDIFVSKLNSSGDFVFAKAFGDVGFDNGISITTDSSSNVYTTGYFTGTVDFDPGAGTYNLTSAGSNDIFVSKLNSSGDFVFAKAMGGTGADQGSRVVLNSNNIYLVGYFASTVDFDPGAGTYNLTSAGSNDIFVSKLNSSGDFDFAKSIGGTGFDQGLSMYVDSNLNVYISGSFDSTVDFDPGAGTFNLTAVGGGGDAFISKLKPLIAPVLLRATVDGPVLTLTYDEPLDSSSVPLSTDFTVFVNGTPITITNVTVTGSTVVLTLNPYIINTNIVTVSYTPGASPTQDIDGEDAIALSTQAVTNNTSAPQNSSGSTSAFIKKFKLQQAEQLPISQEILTPGLPSNCPVFTKFIKPRSIKNDTNEVRIWQLFLNEKYNEQLSVDGLYGPLTINAINRFQILNKDKILTPWNISQATSYIYKSTVFSGNRIMGCPQESIVLDNNIKLE